MFILSHILRILNLVRQDADFLYLIIAIIYL